MLYGIVSVALIFFLYNFPKYLRRRLTEQIANTSNEAKTNLQSSNLNFLARIEWLRYYPLKKLTFVLLWLFCLYGAVRGIFVTINDPRKTFIFLTVLFWCITLFTAKKLWRYIKLPYHCIPVLGNIKTKEELKASLQGECFEKVIFENDMLKKYFAVLISEHWVVMDGYLFPRSGIEKIYYFYGNQVRNYEQVKLIYSNGEEFSFSSERISANENRQKEILDLLHKISPVVLNSLEETNATSNKKDKSIIYWNMNYKGKFKRTLWFIPVVVILCFITPLFMGRFWLIYDIILVVILIWQLYYTYKMMKLEEAQEKIKTDNYTLCPHCKKIIYKDEIICPHCNSAVQNEHENIEEKN